MIQKQPKILVVSHNCFSEITANGRTLSTFFRNWDKTKVAQFFVNNEMPYSSICNSFYRITDKDLIFSLLETKQIGREFENICFANELNPKKIRESFIQKFRNVKRLFPSILYMLRNGLWSTNRWDNNELNNWIDTFQPDLILLQPGDYSFTYKIARVIAKRKQIPLIVYNSEDYYLKDKFSISPFFYIQRYFFKKEVKMTFNASQLIIYSNDLLEKNLHKYFKSRSTVVMTSSEIKLSSIEGTNKTLRFVYAGNLGHERWKSLVVIGKAAKTINKELVIEVYSGIMPKEANKYFTIESGIDFKGAVSYSKVMEVINESDIVIHTEGFSNFTKWDIRHGFSTKIADLLSSGKCFLMYGPKEIACVDYLIKNEVAWVATSDDELREVLSEIITNDKKRGKYLENAKKLVDERHNVDKNCKMFENLMLEVHRNHQNKI